MGVNWYYMTSSWFGKTKRVGPVSESDLLLRIDQGKIMPDTLLQSPKTKDRWVPMKQIAPAMNRWLKSHPNTDQSAAS